MTQNLENKQLITNVNGEKKESLSNINDFLNTSLVKEVEENKTTLSQVNLTEDTQKVLFNSLPETEKNLATNSLENFTTQQNTGKKLIDDTLIKEQNSLAEEVKSSEENLLLISNVNNSTPNRLVKCTSDSLNENNQVKTKSLPNTPHNPIKTVVLNKTSKTNPSTPIQANSTPLTNIKATTLGLENSTFGVHFDPEKDKLDSTKYWSKLLQCKLFPLTGCWIPKSDKLYTEIMECKFECKRNQVFSFSPYNTTNKSLLQQKSVVRHHPMKCELLRVPKNDEDGYRGCSYHLNCCRPSHLCFGSNFQNNQDEKTQKLNSGTPEPLNKDTEIDTSNFEKLIGQKYFSEHDKMKINFKTKRFPVIFPPTGCWLTRDEKFQEQILECSRGVTKIQLFSFNGEYPDSTIKIMNHPKKCGLWKDLPGMEGVVCCRPTHMCWGDDFEMFKEITTTELEQLKLKNPSN